MGKPLQKINVVVLMVIFTIHNNKLKVLLAQSAQPQYEGKKELPGGLILDNETGLQTIKRKLKETFGYKDIWVQQFHTFSEIKRNPKERSIAIGNIALIDESKISNIEQFNDIHKLPRLSFDHNHIIKKAHEYLQNNLTTLIANQFIPEFFPLNQLQKAFEIIEGVDYDNRNFRKKMIQQGLVKETKKREKNVSHRPAKLYRLIK